MINSKKFESLLAKKLKISKEQSEYVLEGFQELVFELLENEDKIKIADFLVINKTDVPERYYTLPKSDEKRLKESYYKISADIVEKYRKQPK